MAKAFKLKPGASLRSGDVVVECAIGGEPLDLTGATIQWRRRHSSTAVGVADESRAMAAYGVATAGNVSPVYTPAESAMLELGAHVCEVWVTKAGNVFVFDEITMYVPEALVPAV